MASLQRRESARIAFRGLVLLLVVGWFAQMFLVGLAIMADASHWAHHIRLGGMAIIPLVGMLALCWLGRLGSRTWMLTFTLIAGFVLLYGVFHFTALTGSHVWRAFHPVVALGMFTGLLVLDQLSRRPIAKIPDVNQ